MAHYCTYCGKLMTPKQDAKPFYDQDTGIQQPLEIWQEECVPCEQELKEKWAKRSLWEKLTWVNIG